MVCAAINPAGPPPTTKPLAVARAMSISPIERVLVARAPHRAKKRRAGGRPDAANMAIAPHR
jgi:hypothetical protein